MAEEKRKIQFHYKKSSQFRVVHADGAWGGITPDLNLFLSFFNERPPIPESIVHPIMENGILGEEIKEARVSKSGVVREIEIGISLSLPVLNQLIEWLQKQKETLDKIQESQAKKVGPNEPGTADSTLVS